MYILYCIICRSGKSSIFNYSLLHLPVFCYCLSEMSPLYDPVALHTSPPCQVVPRSPHTSLPPRYHQLDLPNEHLAAIDRSDPSVTKGRYPLLPVPLRRPVHFSTLPPPPSPPGPSGPARPGDFPGRSGKSQQPHPTHQPSSTSPSPPSHQPIQPLPG